MNKKPGKVPKAQVGTQWDNWLVIAEIVPIIKADGRKRHSIRIKCNCGNELEVQSCELVTKKYHIGCVKCNYSPSRKVKIGQRFDKLIVTNHITVKDNKGRTRSLLECVCDCGNTVQIRIGVLRENKTNNCGCDHRGGWSGVGVISSTFFYKQVGRAKKQGWDFTVTLDELSALYEAQNRKCALSGLPLVFSLKTAGTNTASLDRIDSLKGYSKENVHWVHRDINLMKMDFTMEEFVSMCKRVAENANPNIAFVEPREKLRRGPQSDA